MYYPPSVLRKFSNFLIPFGLIPQKHKVETLYDETGREPLRLAAVHHTASWRRLYAYLDLRNQRINSRFPIFLAAGKGNFIGKRFLETFPEADRPTINFNDKPRVAFMFGRTIEVLGSVIVTLRLHDIVKYGNFKINVRAYVVEDLAVPTYVCHGDWLLDQDWKRIDTIFCDFKNGNCVIVRDDYE